MEGMQGGGDGGWRGHGGCRGHGGPARPHRQDAVAVLVAPLPAAQDDVPLPEMGAHAGLRGQDEDIGEELVSGQHGVLDGPDEVQVPMDADAVHKASRPLVCQDLQGGASECHPELRQHRCRPWGHSASSGEKSPGVGVQPPTQEHRRIIGVGNHF